MTKIANSNGIINTDAVTSITGRELPRNEKFKRTTLFKVGTATNYINEAATRERPKQLYGELWFEGELCILFADTGVGKSILAVNICHQISSGKSLIHNLQTELSRSKVLYFDFELSDKQFQIRYSDEQGNNSFRFDDNFLRVEIDSDADDIPEGISYEDYIIFGIDQIIQNYEPKAVIIDNITFLSTNNEKAKGALPLMKKLKRIKQKYNISMLILAHTPKRDFSKPLTRNDLAGSKMLINFCDSSFAIGESCNDKRLRYIKQIKVRNTECVYDSNNVVLCEIEKDNSNLLAFNYVGIDQEKRHLIEFTDNQKNEIDLDVIRMRFDENISFGQIAKELRISKSKVFRICKKHEEFTSLDNNIVSP